MNGRSLTTLAAALLLLAGCHRAPRNATELRQHLAGVYAGELHLQGQTETMRLLLTPHNFTERNTQVLEFNSVQYTLLDATGGVRTQGDATMRGTIALPNLEVRLESLGDLSGGEDFINVGSFRGKFSDDLQSADASWKTGYGQESHLKMEASK